MRTKPTGLRIVLVVLLLAVGGVGIYAYRTMRQFNSSLAQFQKTGWGAVALNLRPGDRVPAQGHVISSIPIQGTKGLTPDAPIALYPGAVIQGAGIYPTGSSELSAVVLLGTGDAEQKVVDWYARAWSNLSQKRVARPSQMYSGVASGVTEQVLLVAPQADSVSSVEVQRGPAVESMDEAQFRRWLQEGAKLRLVQGRTMTQIWLIVAVR